MTTEELSQSYGPSKCTITDDMMLFWHGDFSQWVKYPIVLDRVTFNCCEQYMMARKAKLMNDEESYEAIMAATEPRQQKALGRKVKNFQAWLWDANCQSVVFRANLAKFTQHSQLKRMLLATGDRTIVEGSPYDEIWGIGMRFDDSLALDKANWKGKNYLGEAIMQVRSRIIYDQATSRR